MSENKLFPQIVLSVLLLVTIISKHFNCEALALKSNQVNSSPTRLLYPKQSIKESVPPVVDSKPAVALQPPSILSDYYNSILANSAPNLNGLPLNSWPQQEFMAPNNVMDTEYDGAGDDYYNDDNTDVLRAANSGNYYENDGFQPEGWFNGPVIYDTPEAQNDETNDAQLNALMMAYLLDQFDKLNKIKGLNDKRQTLDSDVEFREISTTQPSTTTSSPKVTTHAIPKKLTAKQFRLFQRGQKEVPLLRPAVDNDEKSETSGSQWPTELEERELSQEELLQNLKAQKGQTRTVRDVLTAQLDSLKKEGPKMH